MHGRGKGLTQDRLKELLSYDPETGVFTNLKSRGAAKAGSRAGSVRPDGYERICIDGVDYLAHRLACLYVEGTFPPDLVDHADGDPSNNQWANLRHATYSQNNANRKTVVAHGFRGVTKTKCGWQAQSGKYLGTFKTPQEAHATYKRAAAARFGEFARTAQGA